MINRYLYRFKDIYVEDYNNLLSEYEIEKLKKSNKIIEKFIISNVDTNAFIKDNLNLKIKYGLYNDNDLKDFINHQKK